MAKKKAKRKVTKKVTKKVTNKVKGKSRMPDLGFNRTEFEGRHKIKDERQFYSDIREAIERLMKLPIVRNQTQREEALRSFMFNIRSCDPTKLPYHVGRIGSTENTKFKALMAEVSCLLVAYWKWIEDPTEPNVEAITDHIEYLDQIVRDPDTLKTTELPHGHGKSGSCRYRLTNDRIMNGCKMMEF